MSSILIALNNIGIFTDAVEVNEKTEVTDHFRCGNCNKSLEMAGPAGMHVMLYALRVSMFTHNEMLSKSSTHAILRSLAKTPEEFMSAVFRVCPTCGSADPNKVGVMRLYM